jgi:hypothetical protein
VFRASSGEGVRYPLGVPAQGSKGIRYWRSTLSLVIWGKRWGGEMIGMCYWDSNFGWGWKDGS